MLRRHLDPRDSLELPGERPNEGRSHLNGRSVAGPVVDADNVVSDLDGFDRPVAVWRQDRSASRKALVDDHALRPPLLHKLRELRPPRGLVVRDDDERSRLPRSDLGLRDPLGHALAFVERHDANRVRRELRELSRPVRDNGFRREDERARPPALADDGDGRQRLADAHRHREHGRRPRRRESDSLGLVIPERNGRDGGLKLGAHSDPPSPRRSTPGNAAS